jgi:hypothetical protein
MRRLGASLLLALALALGGCGGGGTSGSSTAEQAPAQAGAEGKKQAHGAQQQPGAKNVAESPANPPAPPRHVPVAEPTPGSAAPAPGVPTTKGADNSIQDFGTEGDEDRREEAIANLLAYRDARRAGQWAKACALASSEFRQQLSQLMANAKAKAKANGDAQKPKGCPETLALFTPDQTKAAARERFQVNEVLSFRVEDEYAYLIFRGAGGKAMFIAMADDGGHWRVNVLEPGVFTSESDR